MDLYEFSHKKQFKSYDQLRGDHKITAEQKVALLVNSSWKYSWYWPECDGNEWVDRVKSDIKVEMAHARKRMDELIEAERLVDSLEFKSITESK